MEQVWTNLEPVLWLAWRFTQNNPEILIFLFFAIVILRLMRNWPDKATFAFLGRGLRASKSDIKKHRQELLGLAANKDKEQLMALISQEEAVEALNSEKLRLSAHLRTSPRIVKEVGWSLIAVEKEYKKSKKRIRSEAAKEVLRRSAEKEISNILLTVNGDAINAPSFKLP